MHLGVMPDLAIFGKALANGYPISAVIGKKNIMESAQDTFISSTFWSERIGYTAALSNIKKFEEKKVHSELIKYGKLINECWHKLSKKYEIGIEINGIEPLTTLKFKGKNSLILQTLYAKFMLEQGFLVGNAVYTTFAYNDSIIKKFFNASKKSFKKISNEIKQNNLDKFAKDEIIEMGFKRLN